MGGEGTLSVGRISVALGDDRSLFVCLVVSSFSERMLTTALPTSSQQGAQL